jgi:predicted nucleic acid-binding protein
MTLPPPLRGACGAILDTMVFIYLFEDHPRYGVPCEWLLQRAAEGDYSGLITPVTMAEVLVRPLQASRTDIADRYRSALQRLPGVALCDITGQTGMLAGALRAKYRLPLPDMLQAACAIEHGGVLLTNDHALRCVSELQVVLLDDLQQTPPADCTGSR